MLCRPNIIKGFVTSFRSDSLTCYKFVALKESILSYTLFKSITVFRQSKLLRIFLMGSQDRALPTHAQNFEPHHSVECDSPPKNWILPHPVMPHPISLLIADHILEIVSLIAFRQIVSNLLPLVQIFSFIITTYLKNFIGMKSITTKQFPPEISLNYTPCIPHLIKKFSPCFILLIAPTMYKRSCPFSQTYRFG